MGKGGKGREGWVHAAVGGCPRIQGHYCVLVDTFTTKVLQEPQLLSMRVRDQAYRKASRAVAELLGGGEVGRWGE